MTEQEQRIAIAEACGFTKIKMRNHGIGDFLSGELMRVSPNACGSCVRAIPDFPHDLNAMNGAEACLTESQQVSYACELAHVSECVGWLPETGESVFRIVRATAAQRAEAFLRVIGRWVDK